MHTQPNFACLLLANFRKPVLWQTVITVWFIGLASSTLAEEPSGDQLTVYLKSGRSFTAAVDQRTNDDQLWLRFEATATRLWRPISWARVVGGQYRGRELQAREVQQLAKQLRSTSRPIEAVPRHTPAVPGGRAPQTPNVDKPKSNSQWAREALARRTKVRSLAVDIELANWDADAEPDGLSVVVYPLDSRGNVLPVDGQLEVQLTGLRPVALPARYSFPRGAAFPRLLRWSRPVRAANTNDTGAVVLLPFPKHTPAKDVTLDAFGAVTARLSVPGHGVFDATDHLVRIRPYRPILAQ